MYYADHTYSIHNITSAQVYFIDDPYDRDWRVVRYKMPRSRRVTNALSEGSLSAPGRPYVPSVMRRSHGANGERNRVPAEQVPTRDVQQAMAEEEDGEDALDIELDHPDMSEDEHEAPDDACGETETQIENPIDDA